VNFLDRFKKKMHYPPSRLAGRRTTSDTTVAEILDTVAPPREGCTGCQLVTCGPEEFLLVIQGPEGRDLTHKILDYVDALYKASEVALIAKST